MLANSYGVIKQVMSSYTIHEFSDGPPCSNIANNTMLSARSGWNSSQHRISEHRWDIIVGMNEFDSIVYGSDLRKWQDINHGQIAFYRGNIGFVAINTNSTDHFDAWLRACLPPGAYCNVAMGR